MRKMRDAYLTYTLSSLSLVLFSLRPLCLFIPVYIKPITVETNAAVKDDAL